ncbi:MAG: cysteine synthase A [Anaerolineales bacterium]|nr:MAG: cysteine synthase A [Anaerolineales bacterium]
MSILNRIGNTPLVLIRNLSPRAEVRIWAKLEMMNPGGSVKDRIALGMIEAAERDGSLQPGGTIIEPTSGNTGIGLALVGKVKGYHVVLTMPESMSLERRKLLAAYGTELVLTPAAHGMYGAIEQAKRLVAEHGYFMPQQFQNPANPQIHRESTGPEILSQCPDRIDYLVAGIGTGGTITGAGEALRSTFPGMRVIGVEPADSAVLSGGQPGPHKIQGIGAGFVPDVLNTDLLDEVIPITNKEAIQTARQLAREEGLVVGISSGAAMAAALKVAKRISDSATIVTVLPDTGERYLSTELFV